MVNGDPELAQAVTHWMISDIQHDGTMITKTMLVSLDNPTETISDEAFPAELLTEILTMHNMDRDNAPQKTKSVDENKLELIPVLFQTQKDCLQQYVEQIDNLLEALLSQQAMLEGSSICHHCDQDMRTTWQWDCMLAMLLCQHCMHVSHRVNPFHYFEQWNGSFFQPANLSEVGTYLWYNTMWVNPCATCSGSGVPC